jgi:ABC-type sugar transport system permease subunit
MSLKEQFENLKNNWLIFVLAIVVIGAMVLLPNISSGVSYKTNYAADSYSLGYGASYESYSKALYNNSTNFSPDVLNRKIVKTSNLGIETKIGKFKQTDLQLRDIVKGTESIILTENIYSSKVDSKEIFTGNYTIKVHVDKLDLVTNQLKTLGKVTSFNQGADDVTGEYTNVNIELQVEKERLERYQDMYADAEDIKDKIELNDRIFNQERTIKYLEDAVKDVDQRVDYSTIYLTVNERSDYLGIAFVKLSDLLRSFMGSLNSLIRLIVLILPWAIIAGFIYAIARLSKKPEIKKKR